VFTYSVAKGGVNQITNLASDKASFVTGSIVGVDGGFAAMTI
jgi:hypothetical protein